MELIDRIKKDIDDRLEELRPQIEEIPRLEAALAALEATRAGARAGRSRGRATGAARGPQRSGRRRARRGQRREELIQLLKGHPEISVAEAARQMGVSSPQVSTLLRRLREEGVVTREDGRFVVVEPAAAPESEAQAIEGPGVEGLETEAR
jgi:DNA-binding transcriptional ArsR family regulator